MGQLSGMLTGAGSRAQGPDTPSTPREPRPTAPIKEVHRKDLHSRSHQPPGPSAGLNPGQQASSPLAAPEPQDTGSGAAAGPLACLGRQREARLPFSRFLDEVTVRVLDPRTLEAFRGLRARSPGLSPEEQGPAHAGQPLAVAVSPKQKDPASSPQLSPEVAAGAADPRVLGQPDTGSPCVGSGKHRGQATSPWRPSGQVSHGLGLSSTRPLAPIPPQQVRSQPHRERSLRGRTWLWEANSRPRPPLVPWWRPLGCAVGFYGVLPSFLRLRQLHEGKDLTQALQQGQGPVGLFDRGFEGLLLAWGMGSQARVVGLSSLHPCESPNLGQAGGGSGALSQSSVGAGCHPGRCVPPPSVLWFQGQGVQLKALPWRHAWVPASLGRGARGGYDRDVAISNGTPRV